VENLHTVGIVPVYSLTEGLGAKTLRKLIRSGVDYWSERIPDHIPAATLERTELADLGWALKHIHFPEGPDHLMHAQRRFTFDELLLLQLAVLRNRRAWQSVPGQPISITDEFLDAFLPNFWMPSCSMSSPIRSLERSAVPSRIFAGMPNRTCP